VNFDRIRETLRKDRLATGGTTPFRDIINQSANLMLPRTLMTGGTTLTSTLIMVIFGGPLLKAFAFTIFVGVILGTFASVFIASPVLLMFERRGREGMLDLTEEEQKEEPTSGQPEAPAGQAESGEEKAQDDSGNSDSGQTPAADGDEKK
jgi:preprotein translocase subunit SecF